MIVHATPTEGQDLSGSGCAELTRLSIHALQYHVLRHLWTWGIIFPIQTSGLVFMLRSGLDA